ncbi:MAG: ABA4-like family protein [Gemmataceae bacterium]
MTPDTLFRIVNLVALPFWVLMVFAPRWRFTRRLMESMVGPGLFAVLYAVLVLPGLGAILPQLIRPELEAIVQLLSQPEAAVIAWIHFLAFDLFVGRWEYLDAQERGLSHLLLAPILVLTLMFGPLGLLAFLIARPRRAPERKSLAHQAPASSA